MKKVLSAVAVAAIIGSCVFYSPSSAAKENKNIQTTMQTSESAGSYMSRASNKFMKNDIQGAISDLDTAISLEPNNQALYLNRGYLKHVINDKSGAMTDYDTAIKINPNYAFAYNNRGVLKAAMGDIQGAMDDYEKAVSLNPKYSDVYYNRGNLKYMISDNKGALADYDKAIQLNPKDSEAYNNRGVVKKRLDYNVGALSDYSQAIVLNPKDSIALANRGRLKKLYFDNEGAAVDLNQAVALAETQTFIKNVKPLVSNERYIAAIPVVNGITEDNPKLVKIEPTEKLVEKPAPKSVQVAQKTDIKPVQTKHKPKDGEKIALAGTSITKQPAKTQNTSYVSAPKSSTPVLNAGIGTVKAIEVPDIRTTTVTKTPTTNIQLAESYYIRGLQKCVLRDLQGAVADLDKAIANNGKYADAYFYRAAIRKELGDTEGFRKDYATAIEINPSLQAFNDSNAIGLVR